MPAESDDTKADTHDDGQPAKRKRLRIPKSCLPCLKGKRACDRGRPACGRCVRSGQSNDCSYDSRLPQPPASRLSRQTGAFDYSDDDDDDDDKSFQDLRPLDALQKQLEEARNECRRLQRLLGMQQSTSASSSRYQQPSQHRPSIATDDHYSHISPNDMNAARGLQMLVEIAGPQHQDAHSNAAKSRILHWSTPASHASSSSQALLPHSSHSTSNETTRPSGIVPSSSTSSPADRFTNTTSSSPVYKAQFERRTSHLSANELDSPKNINGTHMYYGDTSSGDKVLHKVAAGTAGSSRTHAGKISSNIHETLARRDMQSAFNSVLDSSRDTFPFATIWSSGTAFIDEVLPFFPRPDEFDNICASFVCHFSAMCPALTIPTAIDHAKAFSRMSRKQQAQVSLPWFAVFLMICAHGKNCDLESTSVGLDHKVHMLDAFIIGEASQQHSRHASRAASPLAHAETLSNNQPDKTDASQPVTANVRSFAMVSDLFLSAAYQSLRLCSFLSAPTLQTIHSQLLIGAYLLNTERAASFWPLLGSVARQAQSIGLHVDPYKIKPDWDPVEVDIRRRLWWAVVHQDVILSSIFGRPLGITRFSCRFPGNRSSGDPSASITYAVLQCEFSQLARIYLDENQDRSWSQAKVIDFTEKVLEWYMKVPDRYRPDIGRIDLLGSDMGTDRDALHNYRTAGVGIKTKGLMEVHQSGNLAVEVFYMILSLHRSNLFPNADVDADALSSKADGSSTSDNAAKVGAGQLNQVSLHICAQALRRITRAQTTMIDLLGRARATMFWKIAYYTYQAAIAGAYIVFVHPQSKHAESALEDLAILTEFFDRMPEKWTGLKMAKPGLRVLRKLAVAARETPEAASMAVRSSQLQQPAAIGISDLGTSPMAHANGFGNVSGHAQDGEVTGSDNNAAAVSELAAEATMAATTSSNLIHTPAVGNVDTSQMAFNSQSAFLPPLFNLSFMSPTTGTQSMMNTTPIGGTSTISNDLAAPFSEPPSAFAGAPAASSGSPLTRSLASVPLVTLFNNTYDHQDNSAVGAPKQSFCYDPFIPDPSCSFSHEASSSNSAPRPSASASPRASERATGMLNSTATGLVQNSALQNETGVPSVPGAPITDKDRYRAAEATSASAPQHDANTKDMNHKDLANYWSEYFSLQLDWDRLTGLA